ncbi:MAG: hypothetical protein AB4050_06055 [Synechococcus sp.]
MNVRVFDEWVVIDMAAIAKGSLLLNCPEDDLATGNPLWKVS